jgi:hypothetical protein
MALLFLLSTYGQGARAQSSSFSIALRAPEDAGCPTERVLVRAVEARVGALATPPGQQPSVAVSVGIDRTSSGFRAVVDVSDQSASEVGRRELRSDDSCDALFEVLTLVVAASIGVGASPVPEPRREPPPPPAAEQPPEPEQEANTRELEIVHDTTPEPPWRWAGAAMLRLQTGIAPGALLAPSLALWASRGPLRLGVSGSWLLPRTDALQDGLSLRTSGAYGELDLCGMVAQSARAGLGICVASQAGAMHATLQGLALPAPRWDALFQLAAGVHAELLWSEHLGVALALGAALPIVYPRYSHVDERAQQRVDHTVELGVWGGLGLWVGL